MRSGTEIYRNPVSGFALALAICLAWLYPDVLFGGQNFYYRDFGNYSYPLAFFARESFRSGEFPLWNPLSYCGLPFLAQWNTMVLYPGSWLAWLLPLEWSLAAAGLAHLLLGGIGMFVLARSWTGSTAGAAGAGFGFGLGGLALQSLMWPSVSAVLAWMPWVIWSVNHALAKGGCWIAIASLIGSAQMLAGTPEFIVCTWLLAAISITSRPPRSGEVEGAASARTFARRMVRFGVIVLLVSLVCAAQLLPFFQLLTQSQRLGGGSIRDWPLPLDGLANYFVPLYGMVQNQEGVYVQPGQNWTGSYYCGVIVLACAMVGFWKARSPRLRIMGVLAAGAGLLALGEQLPANVWLQQWFPPLKLMQFSVKWLAIPAFVLPLAAAFGIAELHEPRTSTATCGRKAASGVILIVILLVIWISSLGAGVFSTSGQMRFTPAVWNGVVRVVLLLGTFWILRRSPSLNSRQTLGFDRENDAIMNPPRSEHSLNPDPLANMGKRSLSPAFCLLALIAIDLLSATPRLNPVVPRQVYEPGLVRLAPPAKPGEGRAFQSAAAYEELMTMRMSNPLHACTLKRLSLWANWNLLDGIAKVDGFFPLTLDPMDEIHTYLYRTAPRAGRSVPQGLLDLAGVRHQTSLTNHFEWTPRSAPLEFITGGQSPIIAGPVQQFEGIMGEQFDPRRSVYLDPAAAGSFKSVQPGLVNVQNVSASSRRVAFSASAAVPSIVVISQAHYPAWKARVNGQETLVFRANFAFQAVVIPAGKSSVEIVYHDAAFRVGGWISIGSFAAVLGLLLARSPLQRTHI